MLRTNSSSSRGKEKGFFLTGLPDSASSPVRTQSARGSSSSSYRQTSKTHAFDSSSQHSTSRPSSGQKRYGSGSGSGPALIKSPARAITQPHAQQEERKEAEEAIHIDDLRPPQTPQHSGAREMLQQFLTYIKNKRDEDGNPFIEFPETFDVVTGMMTRFDVGTTHALFQFIHLHVS